MADICDRSKWYRNLWFPCKDGRRRRKKRHTHTHTQGEVVPTGHDPILTYTLFFSIWVVVTTTHQSSLHPKFFVVSGDPKQEITIFFPRWCGFGSMEKSLQLWGIKGWSLWKSIIGCGKENPFLMGYEEFFKKEFNEQYGTVYKYVHMCIVMNVLFWWYFLKSLLCCVLIGFDNGVVRVGLKQNHNHQSCLTRLVISPAVVCVCSNQGNSDRSCELFRLQKIDFCDTPKWMVYNGKPY